MHSKEPPRNRLAKCSRRVAQAPRLPRRPKRKYTAVLRATLVGGRVIEDLIIEQGWIIATTREGLGGTFEQRIDFDRGRSPTSRSSRSYDGTRILRGLGVPSERF
jgi:hypothetical protein